jgi:hypothetical protein
VKLRDGYFTNSDGVIVRQAMRFEAGNTLHVKVNSGKS